MLSKRQLRNVHISIGVGAMVAVVGAILMRNASEGVTQLLGLAILGATFGTLILLNAREERRERREGRDPQ